MKIILFFFITIHLALVAQPSPLYIIRGDKHFPPYEFLNKNKQPDGFGVDLIKAVIKEMNLSVDLKLGLWIDVRRQIEEGKIDALIGMYYTKERARKIDFSSPYIQSSYKIFIPKNSKVKSFEDLKNKVVLVTKGEVSEDYLKKNHPSIKVIAPNTAQEVLKNLLQGHADAAIMSHLHTITMLDKNKIKNIRSIKKPVFSHNLSFAVKKGNTKLLKDLEEGLMRVKANGTYDAIYKKWFSIQREKNTAPFFQFLIFILLPIFFIIGLISLWTISLKKQVRLKISELKENKENLRIMFESIGDGILVTDLHSHITMMNPIAEKILGWKLEEVIGKKLDRVAPNKTMPFKKRIEDTLLHGQEVITGQITIITRFDKEYDIHFTSTPIHDSSGNIHGFIIVFHDITQELKLQEQLHRYSKLETIGELAGGVAHDFNNMLSGIMGAVQVINTLKPSSTPEQKEYMELIEATILRASSLTEKLLNFGRKTTQDMSPLQLENILKDTFRLLKGSLHKNIQLNLSIQSKNDRLNGNKSALQNLFMNLAINAEYAMPTGGEFNITVKNYDIDMNTSKFTSKFMTKLMSKLPFGEYLEIKVSDTGLGISPENIQKVFDPFFSTKPQNTGIGLGLSSVYGIVQSHGGIITVQSEMNQGTTFTILLPCLPATLTEKTSEQTIQKQKMMLKASILVVDDEEIIRKTATHILKHLGYSVLSAENGIKAIDIIKQKEHDIDLVITDMMMPEMDGKELFLKVKEFNKKLKKEIKVVMASGFTKDETIQELKKLGLSGFLNKPYIKSEMNELIKKTLQ